MKDHSELLGPWAGGFVKDSQNINRREHLHRFVTVGSGVLLLLMIILQQIGYLQYLIFRPLDMNDYWVIIPAGEFQMGYENGHDNEKPAHTVYVDAFEMGRYEVTNHQYAQCIKANVCVQSDYDKDLYSVVNVTWYDAKTYCEWVGGRLPTETEWEKAASYYGIYDMAGNVWEWTSSLYRAYPYTANDGRENLSSSDIRVVRGGSWDSNDLGVRSAVRIGYPSAEALDLIGFRCARSSATPVP